MTRSKEQQLANISKVSALADAQPPLASAGEGRREAASPTTGFQQVFKNVDDILHKDSGCTSELDYTEQSSWLLFLRYLDDLEVNRSQEAELTGSTYSFILQEEFRWGSWAVPRDAKGVVDHNAQLTGPDLLEFVNEKLFPYLKGFKQRATSTDTIEYKIGEIFDEVRNRIASGYNMRDVIDQLDRLTFRASSAKHELSDLYEVKIKNMGNAGRNGGEYYTPRPLIRSIIQVVDPKIGETIYDGAVGSAGFLCEAFEYLTNKPGLTTSKMKTLQTSTFYGREKKSLAYVIAVMNMILHGIDAPNIVHMNTLSQNVMHIEEKDRYDVVLANPPFGGQERAEVQQNFPIRSSETAYLFLQHFIKILRANGRAGIVIKNTFLSNMDSASVSLRRLLLENCDLHTVLVLPTGTFQGAGVRTVVLIFTKGCPTKRVWFYQLEPGRNLGKTDPLNDDDLADFMECSRARVDTSRSWGLDVSDLDPATFDLTARNPTEAARGSRVPSAGLIQQITDVDIRVGQLMSAIRDLQELTAELKSSAASVFPLDEIVEIEYGTRVVRKRDAGTIYPVYGGGGATFSVDMFNREDRMIVSRFGMSERCVRWVAGRFFLNDSGLTVTTKDAARLSQDFLDEQLLARSAEIYSSGKGAAQKNLDMNEFRALRIVVPDVDDQVRAVEAARNIRDHSDEIESLAIVRDNLLTQLRSSLLSDVFRWAP